MVPDPDCDTFKLCKRQSKVDFGFVPLTSPVLPTEEKISHFQFLSITELYLKVKNYGLPNYLGARLPLQSQLNISKWEEYLVQWIQFLKFRFPVGFYRECSLKNIVWTIMHWL